MSSYGKGRNCASRDLRASPDQRHSAEVFLVLELERPCSEGMSTGAARRRKPGRPKPPRLQRRTPRSARWAGPLLARPESDGLLAEERGVPEGPSSTAKRALGEVERALAIITSYLRIELIMSESI
jgi:hypothetical protein